MYATTNEHLPWCKYCQHLQVARNRFIPVVFTLMSEETTLANPYAEVGCIKARVVTIISMAAVSNHANGMQDRCEAEEQYLSIQSCARVVWSHAVVRHSPPGVVLFRWLRVPYIPSIACAKVVTLALQAAHRTTE